MLARSILVGVYQNSLEAGLGQALLEEEGIASEIENLTSQSWLAGDVPLTGFRLMVDVEHAVRARSLLDRGPPAKSVAEDEEGVEDEEPAARGHHAALGPMAAMSLGMLLSLWGPVTYCVAAVWTVSLLASAEAPRLPRRMRFLLLTGLVVIGSGVVVLNASLFRALFTESSFWMRWALDGVVALVVLWGFFGARPRWHAR